MTAAQGEMRGAAIDGDIDRIIACGRRNPRLLLEAVNEHGHSALFLASNEGHAKGS